VARTRRRSAWAIGAATVLALAAGSAGALTLAAMSLGEMTSVSDTVVRARCIDRTATRTSGGGIESVARFEVLEAVKGNPGKEIEVRQLGGSLDGTDAIVPGAPLSEEGDEVVLFLERRDDGNLRVVGVALGYLPVVQATAGPPVVRVSPHLGESFESGGLRRVDDFLGRVRRLAERDR